MLIPPRLLEQVEQRQGVIQREDLLAPGLSRHQIERLVRTGQLSRLHRGIYRVSGMPEAWEQVQCGYGQP